MYAPHAHSFQDTDYYNFLSEWREWGMATYYRPEIDPSRLSMQYPEFRKHMADGTLPPAERLYASDAAYTAPTYVRGQI